MASCVISSNEPAVTMPDGETLEVSLGPAQASVEPFADSTEISNFIRLNYLMRPPLSEAEIQLMPVGEVIALYYGLRKVVNICHYAASPLISAGLPSPSFNPHQLTEVAITHELNLQDRIRSVRPELLSVSNGSSTYRVLLPPDMLVPPPCPESQTGAMAIGIIGGIIGILIPIVGLAVAAYQAGDEINNAVSAANAANVAEDVLNEVKTGIQIAEDTIPNPVPTAAQIAALQADYQDWQNDIATAVPMAFQVNTQAIHICDPASGLLGDDLSLISTYTAKWTPYTNFFFSNTVKQMVLAGSPGSTISSGVSVPILAGAGIGIGALLLLLL